MNPLRAVRRMLGREEVPVGFAGTLHGDERVLAVATVRGGGHVVVTSRGLWPGLHEARVGWHRVSRAAWRDGALELVEADEEEIADGVVLLTDRVPRRLRLAEPGRVPQVVQERVMSSIRGRHHRDLPGGGAWFVQRRVAGRDGVLLQVRPDPGTDLAAARQVAADAGRALGLAR